MLELDLAYESGRVSTRHSSAVETTIYRLVQEALTNAVKHAQATRLVVSVSETTDHVDIVVGDDGVGFDPDASVHGFGLIGMRERVSLVGGTFEVDSKHGSGTTVHCRIPTPRAESPPIAATPLAS